MAELVLQGFDHVPLFRFMRARGNYQRLVGRDRETPSKIFRQRIVARARELLKIQISGDRKFRSIHAEIDEPGSICLRLH